MPRVSTVTIGVSGAIRRGDRQIRGPQVLIHDGKIFEDVMRESKMTRKELDTALRHEGFFEIG